MRSLSTFLGYVTVCLIVMGSSSTGALAQSGSPVYDLYMELFPEENRMEVAGEVQIPPTLVQNGMIVLLHSPEVQNLDIESAETDSISSQGNEQLIQHMLFLPESFSDTVTTSLSFEMTVPPDHRLNRITPEWIELNLDSFWLPIVSSIPNITYTLEVDLGGDYELISGDRYTQTGTGTYVIHNEISRRDIPFSAGKDLRVYEGTLSEAYSPLENVDLEQVAVKSDSILTFLKEYTGREEDFTQPRRVVLTPREQSGYSRKNYIAMSDVRDMSGMYLSDYLAHEFSHYWFSMAHFQTRHHWLTESFAEYVSMIYMTRTYGEEWLEEDLQNKRERIATENMKMADFESRPSQIALYHRGPLVLHAFHEKVGDDGFQKMIRAFIEHEVRTNEELFGVIDEELGPEAVATLQDLMETV